MAKVAAKGVIVHQGFDKKAPAFSEGLSALLTSLPGLFALAMDENDNIIEATETAIEIFALGPNARLGDVIESCPSDDRAEMGAAFSKARSKPGTLVKFNCRQGTEESAFRYLSGHARVEPGTDGSPEKLLIAGYDLTEERAPKIHYEEVLEGSIQGVLVLRKLDVLYCNHVLLDILGMESLDEINEQNTSLDLVHPGDRERIWGYNRARLAGVEAPSHYEMRLLHTDGHTVWVSCHVTMIEWDQAPAILMTFLDVSGEVRANADKERYQNLLDHVFDLSPDGMALTTAEDGRFVEVNRAFESIIGLDRDDIIGKTVVELGIYSSESDRIKVVSVQKKDNAVRNQQLVIPRGDGSLTNVSVSIAPTTLDDEEYFITVIHDINRTKQVEEELRQSKESAVLANRSKSNFLANMSHELRTPLNAILGFSELIRFGLEGSKGQERLLEYATDIHASGHHLLEIINDILDVSRIEAGKMDFSESRIDAEEVMAQCLRLNKHRFKESNLKVAIKCSDGPILFYADKRRIKQIIINLLSNAIKFTAEGGTIELGTEANPDKGIRIYIKDSGCGMSEEDIDEALTPFGQVGSPLTRRHAGVGLGLPLVKSLVELHEGELFVESILGEGTTVSVVLPYERRTR